MTKTILPILIIGQSLAEGRGATHSIFSMPSGKLLRYYSGIPGGIPDDCVDPAYPGHTAIGSPWPSFGWHLFHANGQIPICLVFAPIGGSAVCGAADIFSVGNWDTMGGLRGTASTLMTNALAALVTAGYAPLLPIVIQIGGQTDALALQGSYINQAQFIASELILAAFFRTESWGYASMPFYCCAVGDEPDLAGVTTYFDLIHACMERCACDDPFFKIAVRSMRYLNNHGGYLSGSHPNQVGNDFTVGPDLARCVASAGRDEYWRAPNITGYGPPDNNTLWRGWLTPSTVAG